MGGMATSVELSFTDAQGDLVVEGDVLLEEATGQTWVVVDGAGPASESVVVLERTGIAGGRRTTVTAPNGRLDGFVATTW